MSRQMGWFLMLAAFCMAGFLHITATKYNSEDCSILGFYFNGLQIIGAFYFPYKRGLPTECVRA